VLRVHQATRYVVPLREGGSLPAVVDTEDGGLFVVKFRGAGQGAKALVAEILVGGLARAVGLPVPEIALVEIDESFGRTERDPEIQDILKGSRGVNFGMRYLESAFNFDPSTDEVEPQSAADIVWLDAVTLNIDRTAKNPNLMWHEGRVWLIDHGAALYFHHDWAGMSNERPRDEFAKIEDHVLLAVAGELDAADARLSARLSADVLESVLDDVPDALLMDAPEGVTPPFASAAENRDAYRRYFQARLAAPRPFLARADRARTERLRAGSGERKGYRR
jgi:hypothetical protein